MTTSPESEPGNAPSARPGVPWWWRPIAVVLGVAVVGLAAFSVTRSGGGTAATGSDAKGNADAACALMGEVPDAFDITTQGDEQLARMGAAETLAQLAAARDAGYKGLADALRAPRAVVSRDFSAEGPAFAQALAEARAACARR